MDERTGPVMPGEVTPVHWTTEDESAVAAQTSGEDEFDPEIESARLAIEETRAEMTETVDAIKERLSPHRLMEEAKDAAKEKAQEALSNTADSIRGAVHSVTDKVKGTVTDVAHSASESLGPTAQAAGTKLKSTGEIIVETIRVNPLAAAITGIGLGWLLVSAAQQTQQKKRWSTGAYDTVDYTPSSYDATEYESYDATRSRSEGGIRESLSHVSGKVGEKVGKVGEKVGEGAHRVKEGALHAVDSVKDKAQGVATTTREKTSEAVSSLEHFVHEQPLAAGAIAVVVGALVGLALPVSESENRLLGGHRDRLLEQAGDAAQDLLHKVQSVAQDTIGTAKETFKDAAKETIGTAKDSLKAEGIGMSSESATPAAAAI
jgi:Uncharacterized conserved protein